MKGIKLLNSAEQLQREFDRCCSSYKRLTFFVAWVGHPRNLTPYAYLSSIGMIKAYVGVSFLQTSPDGIQELIDNKCKIHIVEGEALYHPKAYFFQLGTKFCLIVGSSNFTYSGFSENYESNILIEGRAYNLAIAKYLREHVKNLKKHKLRVPNDTWLAAYRKRYEKEQHRLKKSKVRTGALHEDKLASSSSWLATANWDVYKKHIRKGLERHSQSYNENFQLKTSRLDEYKEKLASPWNLRTFDKIENRRMLLGKGEYGWLGHVGASGQIQHILANGTLQEKKTIVSQVNSISKMKTPLDFTKLRGHLKTLSSLGPTIKVWGRLLAIMRPDIFCTISSKSVRSRLSVLLDRPKSYFETNEGYIALLMLIHQAPWYSSNKPANKGAKILWNYRAAFLDVVFYD